LESDSRLNGKARFVKQLAIRLIWSAIPD